MRSLTCRAAVLLSVAAASVSAVPAAAETAQWRSPLRASGPLPVLTTFDPPPLPWQRGHRGVDLAARPGEPVFAAGGGRVRYAGMLAGRGVVSIAHGGLRTTYEPVIASVRAGQTVSPGERIGVVDPAPGHCTPRTCLHWGLLRGSAYLDPLSLLGRGPVRLLPVWEAPAPGVPVTVLLRTEAAPAAAYTSPLRESALTVSGRSDGTQPGPRRHARGCACRYAERSRSTDTWV